MSSCVVSEARRTRAHLNVVAVALAGAPRVGHRVEHAVGRVELARLQVQEHGGERLETDEPVERERRRRVVRAFNVRVVQW